MAGISGLQLCDLLETEYGRFDARKRRAKAIVGANAVTRVDHAAANVFPLKSFSGWRAAYDLEDTLMLAVALEGERNGLDPEDAARLAVAADAARVFAHDHTEGDFFVGRVRLGGGRTMHAGAPWSKWQAFLADEATPPDSLFTVNVSAVLRWIKQRAASLGLAEALNLEVSP